MLYLFTVINDWDPLLGRIVVGRPPNFVVRQLLHSSFKFPVLQDFTYRKRCHECGESNFLASCPRSADAHTNLVFKYDRILLGGE